MNFRFSNFFKGVTVVLMLLLVGNIIYLNVFLVEHAPSGIDNKFIYSFIFYDSILGIISLMILFKLYRLLQLKKMGPINFKQRIVLLNQMKGYALILMLLTPIIVIMLMEYIPQTKNTSFLLLLCFLVFFTSGVISLAVSHYKKHLKYLNTGLN